MIQHCRLSELQCRSCQRQPVLALVSTCATIPKLQTEKSRPKDQAQLSARGFRFAIVASRWNEAIVSALIDGAKRALTEASADNTALEIFRVPGAFEIPLCAQRAAESGEFDAVICLGVIIRGETPHFEYIAATAARGISEASLRTGVPLLFGVITADNIEQANDRAAADSNNKGYEAAMAAVEMVNLLKNSFGSG
jgi:6,7-dimethyl-8-ribityllumazine synthase